MKELIRKYYSIQDTAPEVGLNGAVKGACRFSVTLNYTGSFEGLEDMYNHEHFISPERGKAFESTFMKLVAGKVMAHFKRNRTAAFLPDEVLLKMIENGKVYLKNRTVRTAWLKPDGSLPVMGFKKNRQVEYHLLGKVLDAGQTDRLKKDLEVESILECLPSSGSQYSSQPG